MAEKKTTQAKAKIAPKKEAKKEVKKAAPPKVEPKKEEKKKSIEVEMKPVDNRLVLEADQVPYLAMDQADDEMILAEIEGKVDKFADKLVYSFQGSDGKPVNGLSWVGTKTLMYHFRNKKIMNLSVEEVDWDKDPSDANYYIFKAKVRDLISGASSIGLKRQPTFIEKNIWKEGVKKPVGKERVPNNFWLEQGRTKAIRNALYDLMPAEKVAEWIKKWIEQGKYQTLGAGNKNQANTNTVNLAKIQNAINYANNAKTKAELEKANQAVDAHTDWNSAEKWKVKDIIKKRMAQL